VDMGKIGEEGCCDCWEDRKERISVYTEVTFWNSVEYGILCRSDFISFGIPRNFLLLSSVEFHAISCTVFRIRILSNKFMQKTLDFFVFKT
jgi:hypothetical protein